MAVILKPLPFTDDVDLQRVRNTKTISNCPPETAIPELIRNALQAKGVTDVHVLRRLWRVEIKNAEMKKEAIERKLEIMISADLSIEYALVPKLAIRNNGVGIDPKKLYEMRKIGYSDGKEVKGDHGAFGFGGRGASLSYSPEGVVIISRCDEENSGLELKRGKDEDGYFYASVETDGVHVLDSTGLIQDLYDTEFYSQTRSRERFDLLSSQGDWTEVILIGKHIFEDTTTTLDRQSNAQYWVGDVIYDRFLQLPDPTCNMWIDNSILNPKQIKSDSCFSKFVTVENQSFFVEHNIAKDEQTGIKCHFFYDPDNHNSTAIGGSNSFFAIAYRGEMLYNEHLGNYSAGKKWGAYSANFGFTPKATKKSSLIIELPDNYPVRNGLYRDELTYIDDDNSNRKFDPKELGEIVKNHLPKWLIELNRVDLNKEDNLKAMMSFINETLDDLVKEFSVAPVIMESKYGKIKGVAPDNTDIIELDDYRNDNNKTGKKNPPGSLGTPDKGAILDEATSENSKGRAIITGKRKTINLVKPQYQLLTDQSEILNAGLDGYIGSFVGDLILINGLHPMFEEIVDRFSQKHMPHVDDRLSVNAIVLPQAQEVLIGQLLRLVMTNKYYSLKPDFRDCYTSAISPPNLTVQMRGFINLLVSETQRKVNVGDSNITLGTLKRRIKQPKQVDSNKSMPNSDVQEAILLEKLN